MCLSSYRLCPFTRALVGTLRIRLIVRSLACRGVQYCAKLDKSTYEHPLDSYFRTLYKDLHLLHLGQDPNEQLEETAQT